jgi:TPR repeat protein
MRIGQYALMFKRNNDALGCYIVAANAGDATAQTAVGLLYYQGRGVDQDYTKAFFWLHKAADQGVYAAQRSVAEMYTAGLGTKRDSTLAAIYSARADEQKHDMERRQEIEERAQARREEHAERAADRASRVLSSFVLGASFGLFF